MSETSPFHASFKFKHTNQNQDHSLISLFFIKTKEEEKVSKHTDKSKDKRNELERKTTKYRKTK